MLEAVKFGTAAFGDAAYALKEDKDFVKEVVAVAPAAFAHASDTLRGDRAYILELAAAGHGAAVEGAMSALQADRGFIKDVVAQDPEAFKYAVHDLRHDRDFALEVVKVNGLALQYVSSALQCDADVVTAAVSQDARSVVFAHTSRRNELGLSLPWDSEPTMQAEIKKQPPKQQLQKITAFEPMIPTCAKDEVASYGCTIRVQRMVQFSALSTMTANMGQSNYIAANSWLDKMPAYERPEVDSVTLMWGAVGNIGMRWKAFASADFLNATPEALLSIDDARKVLCITCTKMDPPEWYAGSFFDEWSRQGMIAPTAGGGTGGGWRPGEDAGVPSVYGYGMSPGLGIPTASRGKERATEIRQGAAACTESGPLNGWLNLHGDDFTSAKCGESASSDTVSVDKSTQPVCAGCRVQLNGVGSKSGKTGLVTKQHADGKWKVLLDNGGGKALLHESYIQVLSTPTKTLPTNDDFIDLKALQAQRKEALTEKRERLMAKILKQHEYAA